ncbi:MULTISPECIES: hypothetical protein [Sphingomonadaceae]|jgi:hypothetical protein|nr:MULTISPECIES: hypothetical protein [Sphingomonadaceae]
MEREYEATDDGVVELGVGSELTNGVGRGGIDSPDRQPLTGLLDD